MGQQESRNVPKVDQTIIIRSEDFVTVSPYVSPANSRVPTPIATPIQSPVNQKSVAVDTDIVLVNNDMTPLAVAEPEVIDVAQKTIYPVFNIESLDSVKSVEPVQSVESLEDVRLPTPPLVCDTDSEYSDTTDSETCKMNKRDRKKAKKMQKIRKKNERLMTLFGAGAVATTILGVASYVIIKNKR